jgi:hypothetical protein
MNGADLGPLRAAGVVAVLRVPSALAAVRAVDALAAGGITGIEITYSTPTPPRGYLSLSGGTGHLSSGSRLGSSPLAWAGSCLRPRPWPALAGKRSP